MTTAVPTVEDDTTEEWMARGTYALIAVVGLVVLAVSSRYLHDYAVATGMTDWLSWSLVVALDAGGAGGTLAWIIGRGMARGWGRGIALANLGGSLVGNILGHLISAHQMSNNPWLTILTGAVYPAELWAMIHLGFLLSRERRPIDVPSLTTQDVVDMEEAAGVPVTVPALNSLVYLYRLLDHAEALIYVGITSLRVRDRLTQHRESKPWWFEVASVQVDAYTNRAEALAAERDAIAAESPKYNIATGSTSDFFSREPLPEPLTGPSEVGDPAPINTLFPDNTPGAIPTSRSSDRELTECLQEWGDRDGTVPSRERVRVQYGIGMTRADRIRDAVLNTTDPVDAPSPTTPPAAAKTAGAMDSLLVKARELRTDRFAQRKPCGRRVLMAELGVSDRVARELGRLLALEPTQEVAA